MGHVFVSEAFQRRLVDVVFVVFAVLDVLAGRLRALFSVDDARDHLGILSTEPFVQLITGNQLLVVFASSPRPRSAFLSDERFDASKNGCGHCLMVDIGRIFAQEFSVICERFGRFVDSFGLAV